MKLEYIKANGEYYYPQEPNVQDPKCHDGICIPVCYIKKLWFGRWQVDLYEDNVELETTGGITFERNKYPNVRLILYPSGIQEIRYLK